MTISQIFFAYFATAITVLSLLVITRRNPVHSVLFMLVLFFHIAGLYLFLNAEFIAAIQIIVYAGAILVLFLFVIFLLDLKAEVNIRRYINQWPLSVVIAITLFIMLAIPIGTLKLGQKGGYDIAYIKAETNVKALGKLLYTEYIFPFEVASLILLVGLIGAVILAKRKLKY